MNRSPLLALACAFLLAACGGDTTAPTDGAKSGTKPADTLLLAQKPGDAVDVLTARGKAEGDEVIVVGRVSEMVKGFAAFTITDDSVEWCGRGEEDCGCPTPWDYCCEEERAKAGRLPVELRDAEGEPVAASDTGLRLLDLVVVKGTLAKTESGGLMVLAQDGWFRAERPKLPEGLAWPQ
ncbi:MAG: hypothetical protein P1V36_00525 [Planctomycetota bacterium]|nr:hypothetical protein [Planctomycetota bacterium]